MNGFNGNFDNAGNTQNSGFQNTVPVDSMGRKVGIIDGFPLCSDRFLELMKEDLKLYMSFKDLCVCRDFFKKSNQYSISLSELYMLDEMVKANESSPDFYAITNFLTENDILKETFTDFVNKNNSLTNGKGLPLNISDSLNVASKYMNKIGRFSKPFNPYAICHDKLSNGEDAFSTVYDFFKYGVELKENTAVATLLPTNPSMPYSEYISKVNEFSATEAFATNVIYAKVIGKGGIVSELVKVAKGIYADLYAIPFMHNPPEVSCFATEHIGKVIIALDKMNIPMLDYYARTRGLRIDYFARVTNTDSFALRRMGNISMFIGSGLLKTLLSKRCGHEFKIETSKRANSNAYEIINAAFTVPFMSKKILNIKDGYFVRSANQVVDTVLPLIASGAELKDISLKMNYTFPRNTENQNLDNLFECVLGVYRSLCEFCLPDTHTVTYSDSNEINVKSVAYTLDSIPKINDKLVEQGSGLYLLSYKKLESGLPDYSNLRGMFEFIHNSMEKGIINSASAICGKLSDGVKSMENNFTVTFEDNAKSLLENDVCGILAESKVPLPFGILLGAVTQKKV